eukprot:TRINITY_DN437_c0_g1_i15.p1 TRINITY_DN437_c0_g1~~TRINITY_DN437_c0_g1_i15.p1  ORF type:complete len:187 (-),score=19.09 TRINITY_DN437_c0_g1_i15:963-1523(-)
MTLCYFFTLLLLTAPLLSANPSPSFTMSVISDIHLDFNYDPTVDSDSFCQTGGTRSSTIAPYDRHGCDTPYSLFKSTLEEMRVQNPSPDLIVVPGDMVTHMIPSLSSNFSVEKYMSLKEVIANVTEEIGLAFPKVPVIFTQGNDDYVVNYQVPNRTYKKDFYSFVYEKVIRSIEANRNPCKILVSL